MVMASSSHRLLGLLLLAGWALGTQELVIGLTLVTPIAQLNIRQLLDGLALHLKVDSSRIAVTKVRSTILPRC